MARSALLERSLLHTICLGTSQPGEKPKDGEWPFSWRSVDRKFHGASKNFTLQVKSTKRKRSDSNLMRVDLLNTSKTFIRRNFLRHVSLNDATMSKEREKLHSICLNIKYEYICFAKENIYFSNNEGRRYVKLFFFYKLSRIRCQVDENCVNPPCSRF